MAPAPHTDTTVPLLWRAARQRGLPSPDWPQTQPPRGCRLDGASYTALLRERTTGAELLVTGEGGDVHALVNGTAVAWTGTATVSTAVTGDAHLPHLPRQSADDTVGLAVFTRRGDYKATGMLGEHYQQIDNRF